MFYEEKIIDGVLHYRSAPDDEWSVVSPENMTLTIERLRDELSSQSSRELALVEAAHKILAELERCRDGNANVDQPIIIAEGEAALEPYRGMYE